jgi:hypothetical protein
MSEQQPSQSDSQSDLLKQKYREKGLQSKTLAEHHAQIKKAQKSQIKMPTALKIICATPLIIIFGFGIFFIPFMIYVIMTSPEASPDDKPQTKYEKLQKERPRTP